MKKQRTLQKLQMPAKNSRCCKNCRCGKNRRCFQTCRSRQDLQIRLQAHQHGLNEASAQALALSFIYGGFAICMNSIGSLIHFKQCILDRFDSESSRPQALHRCGCRSDGPFVPIQHRPFEASAIFLIGDQCQMRHQLRTRPVPRNRAET